VYHTIYLGKSLKESTN